MSTSPLPGAVVADANVLLSALIGGRSMGVLAHPRGPRCFAPESVRAEVGEYLPELARKRRLDLRLMLAALDVLPVSWVEADQYRAREGEARNRMASRDVDDWPIVALALALALPIWSQDKDFEQSGLPVYTTGTLLDLLDA